jgi:hypothetical protein
MEYKHTQQQTQYTFPKVRIYIIIQKSTYI